MARARKIVVTDKSLVSFDVGPVRYAVDIARVREVVRSLPVLPVPDARDGLLGVTDYRGQVVPVLDLRDRFGVAKAASEREARWIIVHARECLVALVVDRVTHVIAAAEQRLRDVPEIAQGGRVAPITAAHADRGGLVLLLDVDRLMEKEVIERLSMRPTTEGLDVDR
jgi:purine-binding chemotaxis protein CheW